MDLLYIILIVAGVMALGFLLNSFGRKMNEKAYGQIQQSDANNPIKALAKGLYAYNRLSYFMGTWTFIIGGGMLILIILAKSFGMI